MSQTARSTVKDIEDDLETAGTADNHTPILPPDNHTPVAPKAAEGEESGADDDVTTLDNHTPIAPKKGHG